MATCRATTLASALRDFAASQKGKPMLMHHMTAHRGVELAKRLRPPPPSWFRLESGFDLALERIDIELAVKGKWGWREGHQTMQACHEAPKFHVVTWDTSPGRDTGVPDSLYLSPVDTEDS